MSSIKRFGIMYLNMIDTLTNFALSAANIATTNLVAPFKNGITTIQANYNAIINLRNQAKEVITNFSAQKMAYRKQLITATYNIMKSAYAFGINTQNQQIISAMKVTKRHLNSLHATSLISFVQAAITVVEANLDELTPYGITADSLTDWQKIMDDYQQILSAPVNAIAKRKSLNQQADELLAQSVELLQSVIDPLSFNYISLNNAYFLEYRNNRRLRGTTKHTKFRVYCINDAGNPVYGVTVTQNGTQNTAITDINGQAIVYIQPNEGPTAQPVYNFTLQSGEQTINTGNIQIKKGHTVTRTITVQNNNYIIPAHIPQPTQKVAVSK